MSFTKTRTPTKAVSKTVRHMVWESILGQTKKSMMANGLTVSRKVMAFGKASRETVTWENGSNQKRMDMEFMFGHQGISMKVSGKIA